MAAAPEVKKVSGQFLFSEVSLVTATVMGFGGFPTDLRGSELRSQSPPSMRQGACCVFGGSSVTAGHNRKSGVRDIAITLGQPERGKSGG